MTRNAQTGRILRNDYPSLLMLLCISVMWVIAIGGSALGFLPTRRGGGAVEVDSTMMTVMIVAAVVGTFVFGWLAARRIQDIKRIINTGPEVQGRIQTIGFFKDRGRVEYTYEYDNQLHHAGNAIWKNRETMQLQAGDEVMLIVDPDKPSRAFVASLYT